MITFKSPGYAEEPTHVVTLADPELRDSEISDMEITVNRTVNSTFKTTVRDNRLGKRGILTNLVFNKMTKVEKKAFEQFLIDTQGQYVLYTDYEGATWISLITTAKVQFNRTGCCMYDWQINLKRWPYDVPEPE